MGWGRDWKGNCVYEDTLAGRITSSQRCPQVILKTCEYGASRGEQTEGYRSKRVTPRWREHPGWSRGLSVITRVLKSRTPFPAPSRGDTTPGAMVGGMWWGPNLKIKEETTSREIQWRLEAGNGKKKKNVCNEHSPFHPGCNPRRPTSRHRHPGV